MMYPQKMPRWKDMAQELAELHIDPFLNLSDFLLSVDLSTNFANAQFLYDYADAECLEDDPQRIQIIITAVYLQNKTKYETLRDTYPFSQMRKRIRSPDITRETEGSSGTTIDTARNQTETRTDTPQSYKETREHYVNPFDNTGYKTESKDEVSESGSRKIETKYTGTPDHTASSSEGSRTETETGTETITETVIGSDRLTMAEAMQDMAAASNLWQVIEKDIAAKLFLQVWRL